MINKLIKELNKKIFKITTNRDFSTSFYLIFFYFGSFMYLLSAFLNFIVGLSLITVIIPLLCVSLNILFHLVLFKRGKFYLGILFGVLNNNFIFSPFMWLTNLGFNGGFHYFIFLFMIFTVILLKGKSRKLVVLLYLLEVLSLTILEAAHPELIRMLSGMESNVEDMTISLIMSMIAISAALFILSNLYRHEQEKIIELTTTDSLTKQYNRRFIIALMEKMYKEPDVYQLDKKYAVFIDIDDFKSVNDKFGHNEGDRVLTALCKTIERNIRETDYLARMGGDEFLLILETNGIEQSRQFLKRLLIQIESENNITVSAGLTEMTGKSGTVELLEISDKIMYAAKRAGKNRIFSADDFSEGAIE